MVKDIYGNVIPKGKKARDAQFKRIVAMQRKAEKKRLKASLSPKNIKARLALNYK